MITIHNFARGMRGVRLFWQCEEMGLPYRTEIVTFPPSATYLALNPLGNVPFLEDDGGVAINESVAGMLYLAARYGPTPLLPESHDPLLARVLQLTILGETELGMAVNPLLAAHFGAPEAEKRNWSVRMLERSVDDALSFVVGVLADKSFLVGNDLTLADISVSCALGILRGALGKTLPAELAAFQDRMAARPTYQRARARSLG